MAVFLLIMNMGYHSISEAGNTKASSRQGACSESESSSECKSKDQSERDERDSAQGAPEEAEESWLQGQGCQSLIGLIISRELGLASAESTLQENSAGKTKKELPH
jgi:hypothetical protein